MKFAVQPPPFLGGGGEQAVPRCLERKRDGQGRGKEIQNGYVRSRELALTSADSHDESPDFRATMQKANDMEVVHELTAAGESSLAALDSGVREPQGLANGPEHVTEIISCKAPPHHRNGPHRVPSRAVEGTLNQALEPEPHRVEG